VPGSKFQRTAHVVPGYSQGFRSGLYSNGGVFRVDYPNPVCPGARALAALRPDSLAAALPGLLLSSATPDRRAVDSPIEARF
jgi:hypothetical protein